MTTLLKNYVFAIEVEILYNLNINKLLLNIKYMACFLAPATVAIITTSGRKKISPKYHLEWLNTMLWGGVIMLAVEHIAHGEIVLYPPFLTAMENPADIPVMLQEIAIIGGAMTITIVLVWAVMIFVANKMAEIRKKKIQIITT